MSCLNTKPVVKYVKGSNTPLEAGRCAWVVVIDHPRFAPYTDVRASTVVAVLPNGFETMNTVYIEDDTGATIPDNVQEGY